MKKRRANDADQAARELIGDRFRQAREYACVTQADVSRAFDLHRPTVSYIESGQRSLRGEEVLGFADYFGVSARWLLGDEAAEMVGP